MQHNPQILENDYWQIDVLPDEGASITAGRIRRGDEWVDLMIPTKLSEHMAFKNYASFLLLPWSNRIRNARFRFKGVDYTLRPNFGDGTAIHGVAYEYPWQVKAATGEQLRVSFDSAENDNVNFPFKFSAQAEYRLEGQDFIMWLSLKNEAEQPIPGGFGHHPYFLRAPGGDENTAQLEIPCDQLCELVDSLPVGPAVPITEALDFRELRSLVGVRLDNLLTGRQGDKPVRIMYPAWNTEIVMYSDQIFGHFVVYSPPGQPFFAVEPVTNTNDGFNLYNQGMPETGVFSLEPGEEKSATVRLRINQGG